MAANAPFTSLRLVQLDHLIANLTEEAYKDLQNIIAKLPGQTDENKWVDQIKNTFKPLLNPIFYINLFDSSLLPPHRNLLFLPPGNEPCCSI